MGTKKLQRKIGNAYLPGDPRISPGAGKIAFFGNGRIYVYAVAEDQIRAVVDQPDLHASFCAWSPDGAALTFTAYAVPADETRPPHIYRVDLEENRITQLTQGLAVDRFPQWSPDGRWIAFHRTYVNPPKNRTGVTIVDTDSLSCLALPGLATTAQAISRYCWSADGSRLVVTERQDAASRVRIYAMPHMAVEWTLEAQDISGSCFFPDGAHLLCVYRDRLECRTLSDGRIVEALSLADLEPVQTRHTGPVVAFGVPGAPVYFLGKDSTIYRWRLGADCVPILADQPEELQGEHRREDYAFTARDGREIPVQRYIPPNPKPAAVVFVEGGSGEVIDSHDPVALRLLEAGYEVIRPAYRGSDGYGQEHRLANTGECGWADVWDIIDCGLDWRQRFDAADRPLAVAGFSYGGYLTMLSLTYPAAPWACAISLWGCTHIPPGPRTRGLPQDPIAREQAVAERSPVLQAPHMHFPLLILHGARDTTATNEDVLRIQHQVQENGLECDLVIFDDDTHGLHLHRPEMYDQMLRFLAKHLGE
ncbi:MAG: S9 family peptidase [Chloroflexi bacterium]|nr:S9 family peptidase [Chloroflexota bacterium]